MSDKTHMEVNYREFIRNFAQFKDGVERVAVMGKDGLVGIWYPVSIVENKNEVGVFKVDEVKSPTKVVGSFVPNAASEKFANIIHPKEEQKQVYCKKCGGIGAGTHKYWDEIELEEVEAVFCLRCAKASKVVLKPLI